MPRTMEAKLSSSRIMLAASLATSVPARPMAMPTLAWRLQHAQHRIISMAYI